MPPTLIFSPSILSTSATDNWHLYGTLGCHLCEQAENLLKQAQLVANFSYVKIDIMDLPDSQIQFFADKIPVLITPHQTLYYPFSLMDIMALANK